MAKNVAFLMQDVVLLALPFYLLKQDLARVTPTLKLRDAEYKESTRPVGPAPGAPYPQPCR